MPPEATAPTMNCFRLALACAGSTPPARKPNENAFAIAISCPLRCERGVGDDRGEGESRQRVLQGVAALHRLVPHHQRAGDHDQQHEQRVGDPERVRPQLADAIRADDLRRRQQRLADQLERRVEGVGDEVAEPVVDRLLDLAGDVPEGGVALAPAGDAAAGAAAAGAGRNLRTDLDAGNAAAGADVDREQPLRLRRHGTRTPRADPGR